MLWPNELPVWEGLKTVALILLCLAMICFPFSVAASNLFLGLTLATVVFSGIWWRGVKRLWRNERTLLIALLTYLLLIPFGLLWSLDPDWGLHILARHWFWLLLPAVVGLLSSDRNRNAFLAVMSIGLVANLVFCVLQVNGLVDTNVSGSTQENATGHIGHTSFGFIYGIWSAWLVHWGFLRRDKLAWVAWGLALWAVVMVFMAQGQSGYIITVVLLLLVVVKWMRRFNVKNMVVAGFVFLLIAGTVLALGQGKERITGTWDALTQSDQQGFENATQVGAIASAQARLAWWNMSVDIWRQGAFFGVGTGGFPKAVQIWQSKPTLQHGYINAYSQWKIVHPHNQYLITLVRYGVVGVALLLVLIFVWVGTGIRRQWSATRVFPLVALSGLALALHGLDSTSFEEHFSSIFALILLGVGLSESACNSSDTDVI